jgi:hypothetical protein
MFEEWVIGVISRPLLIYALPMIITEPTFVSSSGAGGPGATGRESGAGAGWQGQEPAEITWRLFGVGRAGELGSLRGVYGGKPSQEALVFQAKRSAKSLYTL